MRRALLGAKAETEKEPRFGKKARFEKRARFEKKKREVEMSERSILSLRRALFLEGLVKGLEAQELHDYIDEGLRLAKLAAHIDEQEQMKAAG